MLFILYKLWYVSTCISIMIYFILSFITPQVLLETIVERIAMVFYAFGEIIQLYILCFNVQKLLDTVSFIIMYFYQIICLNNCIRIIVLEI